MLECFVSVAMRDGFENKNKESLKSPSAVSRGCPFQKNMENSLVWNGSIISTPDAIWLTHFPDEFPWTSKSFVLSDPQYSAKIGVITLLLHKFPFRNHRRQSTFPAKLLYWSLLFRFPRTAYCTVERYMVQQSSFVTQTKVSWFDLNSLRAHASTLENLLSYFTL